MDSLVQFWRSQAAAYPEWLVVSSLAIAGAVALWILLRLFAWLVKWVLIGVVFVVLIGAVLYFFTG